MDKKNKNPIILGLVLIIAPAIFYYLLINLGSGFENKLGAFANLLGLALPLTAFIGFLFILFGVIELVSKSQKRKIVTLVVGLIFMISGLVLLKFGYGHCTVDKLLNCKDPYEFYVFILEVVGLIVLIKWFSLRKHA